jgi:hypothetical protein
MTSIKASIKIGGGLFEDPREIISGILTTDHAASSYGQPVLLADDGRILGPGDVRDGEVGPTDSREVWTPSYLAHLAGETDAADDVSLGIPWQPREHDGPRHQPDAIAILRAAKAAGWTLEDGWTAVDHPMYDA